MRKSILITFGGTKVPIDAVRHIGNMSSGTFGANLAEKLYENRKHDVHVFRATGSRTVDEYSSEDTFVTYDDYQLGLRVCLERYKPDLIISAAAVSDYGVKPVEGKISSSGEVTLTLHPLPKVLPIIKKALPNSKVVGFKLLVGATHEELRTAAMKQIETAGVDLVAGNDLNNIRKGNRKYTMFYPNGDEITIGENGSLYDNFIRLILAL